mgnify:CR=1 FL=1|jgi:hypothetical protein|tara:strand:+ start:1336 stop:1809 length:474 start_codon:yes stop_codon:yes gene_type:complete
MKNDSDNSLKKSLENISSELKGIRTVLGAIWHSRYKNDETDLVSPEVYAEEYISTEECARRLNVSDQTIRNWILQGKKKVKGGWIQGVHYIVIPRGNTKHLIRIPWNNLILTFYKGPEATLRSFDPPKGNNLYTTNTEYKYEPQLNPNTVIPKDVNK